MAIPRASGAPGTTRSWAVRTFDSLGERNFRLLWFGMLLSMGGMQMQMFTRALHAYDMTASATVTALVTMGWAPTMLLFSLYAGVLGERMERRTLIQISQVGNSIIPAVIAVLTLTHTVHWTQLLGASLIQGFMFATQMPARQAVIPTLVGKQRVSNALALNATAMGIMNVAGQAFGGVLYDTASPGGSYIVAASLCAMSVWFTARLPKMYPEKKPGARRPVLAEVGDGLKYIAQTPLVRMLLVQNLVVVLLAFPFRMLVQVFAKEVYGSSAWQIGVLGALAGLGAVMGALFMAGLRPGQPRGAVLMGTAVVLGCALVLAAGLPWYGVGLFAMVLVGLGESGRMALGQSLVIESTADQFRSRVTSVLMMTWGLMPLAVLPLGAITDALDGPRIPIAVMGGTLLVACTYFLIKHTPVRRLT